MLNTHGDRKGDARKGIFHLCGGEAKHRIATCFQQSLPLRVMLALRVVNWAVYFDDETMSGTEKVNREGANGVLTTKLQPIHLAVSQCCPQ